MQSKNRDPFDQMVGQRIKRQRKHLGLTQEELANQIGSSMNYISKIERGISTPLAKMLRKISIALQKPIDYFQMDQPGINPDYQLKPELAKITEGFSTFQWQMLLDYAQLVADRYAGADFMEK